MADVKSGTGRDPRPEAVRLHRDSGDGRFSEAVSAENRVWDTGALDWVKEVGVGGALSVSVTGGGGGPATVADGADVAQGSTTDASSANTVVGILKAVKASLAGTLATSRTWALSSGTDSVSASVSNFPATQAVSAAALPLPTGAAKDSTLTDGTQRVGGTVAVSAAALPLPSGASTETTLSGVKTGTDKIPSGLTVTSTRLLVDPSGVTTPVSLATNTPDVTDRSARLLGHVTVDSMPSTAVTGPLTDTQLRATRVPVDPSGVTSPVSLGSLPSLAAGSAVIGHVIVDTAPTTAVTGPVTDAQLRATAVPVSGTVTANATLAAETTKVIGTVNLSSGQTVGLAAGSQVIGHVVIDSATIAALTDGTQRVGGTLLVDGSAVTQPVSAASLPLPSGAATDVNLAAIRESLNEIAFAAVIANERSIFND